jgi:putative sterol carrier protein
METPRRRRVLHGATDVPSALIGEIVDDMASRMDRSDEARQCAGLSFSYVVSDRRLPVYRYEVAEGGRVTLAHDDRRPSTFTFSGDAETFDAVLRGLANPLKALLTGRVRLHGSLWHIRSLLRMMPAVERAYTQAREDMIQRHQDSYDFRF